MGEVVGCDLRASRAVELLQVAAIPRLTLLISAGPCGRSCDLIDREIADLIGAIIAATVSAGCTGFGRPVLCSGRERQENFDVCEN